MIPSIKMTRDIGIKKFNRMKTLKKFSPATLKYLYLMLIGRGLEGECRFLLLSG